MPPLSPGYAPAKPRLGFTLLELLIVIGILSVLSVAGVGYYRNTIQNIQVDETAKNIISTLRDARSRAIAGQSSYNWGVNFVNSSTPNTFYYELFSTPTDYNSASMTIDSTYYLPGTLTFSSPGSGATTTILFNKITGAAATSSVTLLFEGTTTTINVTPVGNVYK